jgi:hypothetical protein
MEPGFISTVSPRCLSQINGGTAVFPSGEIVADDSPTEDAPAEEPILELLQRLQGGGYYTPVDENTFLLDGYSVALLLIDNSFTSASAVLRLFSSRKACLLLCQYCQVLVQQHATFWSGGINHKANSCNRRGVMQPSQGNPTLNISAHCQVGGNAS